MGKLMPLLAALVLSGAAWAQPAANPAADYVLALSWQPSFCASRDGARAEECRTPAPPLLALHGLWPQNGEYCAAGSQDLRRTRWRDLPPVRLSPDLRRALEQAMPGTRSHLDRYQWIKHGSCSGLDAERYYARAVSLHEQAARTGFARLIRERASVELPVAELCAALGRDLGPDFDKAVRIVQDRDGKGGFRLAEIRIGLAGPDRLAVAPLDRGDGYRCSAAKPGWKVRLAPGG
jgi:ribonuclease T2